MSNIAHRIVFLLILLVLMIVVSIVVGVSDGALWVLLMGLVAANVLGYIEGRTRSDVWP